MALSKTQISSEAIGKDIGLVVGNGLEQSVLVKKTLSCGQIAFTWSTVAIMAVVSAKYGNRGLLFTLPLVAIAQNIRHEKDRELIQKLREDGLWDIPTAVYYVGLFGVALFALHEHVRLMDVPIIYFAIMLTFPLVFPVTINDILTCFRRLMGGRDAQSSKRGD